MKLIEIKAQDQKIKFGVKQLTEDQMNIFKR